MSGPGGVGKGTVVEALLDSHPEIWLSRSWTTRAQRPGEPDDAYVFTDRKRFDDHIAAGGFLEWVDFLDYRQGTPMPAAPPGKDVLFEIDVEGARAIAAVDPNALLVFIDSPTVDDQRHRLVERGDAPERIEARLRKGEEERVTARRARDAPHRQPSGGRCGRRARTAHRRGPTRLTGRRFPGSRPPLLACPIPPPLSEDRCPAATTP